MASTGKARTPPPGTTGQGTWLPPGTQNVREALGQAGPLAQLLQRAQQSKARLQAVAPLLPLGLRTAIRPGPLDEEGWLLLVDHGAAAAKLRQLLPRLEQALLDKGWQATPIKVRIQPRG
jgi:hypothetical protein